MFSTRFLISWIISSIVMFSASYGWHGLFLTDFSKLTIPKGIFFTAASVVYLIIGFVLNKIYEISFFSAIQLRPILRASLRGIYMGISIYLITIVTGFSFINVNSQNILLDFSWQAFEQGLGGLSVGLIHHFYFREFVFQDARELESQ